MKTNTTRKDELLALAGRQSALRDELLQQHDALAREVAAADMSGIDEARATRFRYAASAVLAFVVTPLALLWGSSHWHTTAPEITDFVNSLVLA